jgi:hypothetical protein
MQDYREDLLLDPAFRESRNGARPLSQRKSFAVAIL